MRTQWIFSLMIMDSMIHIKCWGVTRIDEYPLVIVKIYNENTQGWFGWAKAEGKLCLLCPRTQHPVSGDDDDDDDGYDDDDDDDIVKINDVHDDAGTRASAKQARVGRVLRKLHILNQSHRWDIKNSISLPWRWSMISDQWSVIDDQWSTINDQWSFLFQATFQRSFRLRFIAAE